MNQFLFILSVFFLVVTANCSAEYTKSCFSESTYNKSDSVSDEDDKIYSISECYTIIKKLGEGAFGNVYEVEDSRGEKFALKSIKQREDDGFSYYVDAEREFMRGQLLDHPNIIKSFDFFTYISPTGRSSKNILLQLVEGKPLFLIRKKYFEREEGIEAVSQFCDAISYALSLNLLHLDLHSGNVMVSNNADVMIIDLASFFTYDEIFSFVSEQYSEQYSQSYSEGSGEEFGKLQANALAGTKDKKIVAERGEKIKEFFSRNPHLLAHVQKELQKNKKKMNERKIDIQSTDQSQSHTPFNHTPDIDRSPFETYYFDRLTDICMNIITRSNMEREEKVNIQVEIKRVAWYYQADVEDKKSLPLNFYLNQLLEIINTL